MSCSCAAIPTAARCTQDLTNKLQKAESINLVGVSGRACAVIQLAARRNFYDLVEAALLTATFTWPSCNHRTPTTWRRLGIYFTQRIDLEFRDAKDAGQSLYGPVRIDSPVRKKPHPTNKPNPSHLTGPKTETATTHHNARDKQQRWGDGKRRKKKKKPALKSSYVPWDKA